ncbi:MAG: hypothetical protein IH897_03730 [Planctomycetes bacterium]|nr:hypothetical protein [Planctomycetota bacterium]
MKSSLLIATLFMAMLPSGCVEIQALLFGVGAAAGGGSLASDGAGITPGGGGSAIALPEVTLTVSNPNPTTNEEVLLTCRASDPAQAVSSFAFQPTIDLIGVNAFRGTATFIPSAADVSTEFQFTCTGTNESGTGGRSAPQLVIPVG